METKEETEAKTERDFFKKKGLVVIEEGTRGRHNYRNAPGNIQGNIRSMSDATKIILL